MEFMLCIKRKQNHKIVFFIPIPYTILCIKYIPTSLLSLEDRMEKETNNIVINHKFIKNMPSFQLAVGMTLKWL